MMLAAFLFHPAWSVVCIIIAVGMGAYGWCGFGVNAMDIAPRHASIVMGLSNTFAAIPGIISPTLTGILVQNKSENEWRAVFYISSGIYLIACIVYWFWCSGEIQSWAIVKHTNDDDDKGEEIKDQKLESETKVSEIGINV